MNITKRMMHLLLVGALILACESCVAGGIKSSDKVVNKDVSVRSFAKVRVEGQINVEYRQGSQTRVELVCPEDLEGYIEIKNEGDELVLRNKKELNIGIDDNSVKAIVESPSIEGLNLKGTGEIAVRSNLEVPKLAVVVSGSGEIKFQSVRCHDGKTAGDFAVQVNGSGEVEVKGEVASKSFATQQNGSGEVKVNKVASYTVGVQINGSGEMLIQDILTETSTMAISGSGDIKVNRLRANEIEASVVGSGEMEIYSIDAKTVTGLATGSGEIKLHGRCESAALRANGMSEIDATGLARIKDVK